MASAPGSDVPRTTIDWCEENYVVTPYIAEFGNTLSSFALVVLPLLWFWGGLPKGSGAIVWLYPLTVVVGIGSVLFHGTMSWAGQLLDEVPILVLCFAVAGVLVDTATIDSSSAAACGSAAASGGAVRAVRRPWAPGPWAIGGCVAFYAAAATYVYAFHSHLYQAFLLPVLLSAVVDWCVIFSEWRRGRADSVFMKLLLAHFLIGYTGGALWGLENTFCDSLRPFRLHAVWHFTSALAIKPLVELLAYGRLRAMGRSVRLRGCCRDRWLYALLWPCLEIVD